MALAEPLRVTTCPPSVAAPSRAIQRPPRCSRDEERDKWLSSEYHIRRNPLRTPVDCNRPRHAPEPAPPVYGRYAALPDKVPEEDMEWDIEGPDGDPMENYGIVPPSESQAGAAGTASRRSTWKVNTEVCCKKRASRSRGAAAWTLRRSWTWQS